MSSNSIKGIFLGYTGVGKTSLIQRSQGQEINDSFQSTVHIDSVEVKYDLESGGNFPFRLVDTAGQEQFQELCQQYIRGSQVVFFVTAFENDDEEKEARNDQTIAAYLNKINDLLQVGEFIPIFIINKCDITKDDEKRLESKKEAIRNIIESAPIHFPEDPPIFLTSALTGSGVSEAFENGFYDGYALFTKQRQHSKNVIQLNDDNQNNPNNKKDCC
ncbi:GTP-binding protein YPT7 [Tritrichomonas foetus]|uniref:GTP-binding protein YPT7 n=1 Tax=Tritrichomonas foetus TaxID=1144522 RepID=A0A1J4JJR3_9EUKA|nr:GTP-binding protein YPT7 [Tritrichomonas foetus]|eukprot:OHS97789.1 GTP-binding protein YPT7 [Tritrichomonas foetus]